MKNKIKNIIKFTENIEGWLSVQEGIFLYSAAKSLPKDAVIVEIGSWKGKSAIWLASALSDKDEAKVYAIDPHVGSPEKKHEYNYIDTSEEFKKNIAIAKLDNKIITIKKTSKEANAKFNKPIDLLFIDGSHEYKAVKEDFLLWAPKVKNKGWVVLHDATVLTGPRKVALRHIVFSRQFSNIGMLGSIIFGQHIFFQNYFRELASLLRNFWSCLFIISYANLRKIPFPSSWRKKTSKINFKRTINFFNSSRV